MFEFLKNIFIIGLQAAGVVMLLTLFAIFVGWMERKLIARMHSRYGPTQTGKFGLLQTFADMIKFLQKEVVVPKGANKWIFLSVPVVMVAIAFTATIALPYGGWFVFRSPLALVFVMALVSMLPMWITLAGWSSNSKYSMLGGLRAAAQTMAYEAVVLLSVLGVVAIAGSLDFADIAMAQKGRWFVFFQPLGFFLFTVGILAIIERQPVDIPEAESELIAGWRTEYGGVQFALFLLAEYTLMLIGAIMMVTLFFGGWMGIFGILGFWVKVLLVAIFTMLARATYLRLRVDQLLDYSWGVLIPLALINFMVTAVTINSLR
ncbi:MAG TPA: complex I subunit 1 family protein [Patescibacteria group bacterium]|nr:complex I subunit 1 family protein [Patescibacteria group bacterium]